jgi:hypothetical protein
MMPFNALSVALEPGVTLVEASAGTGKTFAITRLVLRLLLEGKVEHLGQILVVTFTEKATQELIGRIRAVLRDADRVWSDTPPPRDASNEDLFIPSENSATFSLFAKTAANKTPSGLPMTSPKKIPHAIRDWDAALIDSEVITTPVFAKAKIGTTMKVLSG